MNKRMFAVPLAAAALVALAACSSPTQGSPSPSTGANTGSASTATTSGGASSGDPLASVDPCSLISADTISKNKLQKVQAPAVPGGRGCRWQHPDTGSGDSYEVDVDIYDTSGLDGMNTDGMTVANNPVGNYPGKLLRNTNLGSCLLGLGVTSTSRVDIDANAAEGNIDTSCKLVNQIAPAVTKNLPPASN